MAERVELQRKGMQLGVTVLICAVVLRLLSGGVPEKVMAFFSSETVVTGLLRLQTGRLLQPAEFPDRPSPTEPTEVPPETVCVVEPAEPARAVFGASDAALVEVNSVCGYGADLPALLQQPLHWDLTGQEPTVLILHTHGTESYTKTEEYTESTAYRTLNEQYNVVSVGDRLEQLLEQGGLSVIHDRTMYDYPSYNDSYNLAREAIEGYLQTYPTIRLVLDIHRDSVADSNGRQLRFVAQNGEQTAAQVMLVVGTDASGLSHPNWPENMSLAVKLHALLEKNFPGLCRPISFRSQRFNQDLSAGALILEIGSAGNTRQEALAAAEQVARAVLELSWGTD